MSTETVLRNVPLPQSVDEKLSATAIAENKSVNKVIADIVIAAITHAASSPVAVSEVGAKKLPNRD